MQHLNFSLVFKEKTIQKLIEMKKLFIILAVAFAAVSCSTAGNSLENETNSESQQELTHQSVGVSWITDIIINTFTK